MMARPVDSGRFLVLACLWAIAGGYGRAAGVPSLDRGPSVPVPFLSIALRQGTRVNREKGRRGGAIGACRAFDEWATGFVTASSSRLGRGTLAGGIRLARARRAAFARLIRSDPQEALVMKVPASLRKLLPQVIRDQLETPVSGKGDYWVLAVDPPMGRRAFAEPFQRFARLNGRTYRASVYGRRLGETSKRGIPLRGVAIGDWLALDARVLRALTPAEIRVSRGRIIDCRSPEGRMGTGPPPVLAEMEGKIYGFESLSALDLAEQRLESVEAALGSVPSAPAREVLMSRSPSKGWRPFRSKNLPSWTEGLKQILIIRVDFPDLPGDPVARDGTVYTASYVQRVADTVIGPYFKESSFGLTSLSNTVTRLYRMPQTAGYYATNNASDQLFTDAEDAAGKDFDLSRYDRLIVLFSPLDKLSGSEFRFGGLAFVGTRYVWLNGEFDFRSVAHELGHTFGLYHADLWKVSDGNPVSAGGTEVDGGDVFDSMGDNFANDPRTDYNPWFKNVLGWIDDAQVETVTESGTYRIHPFDQGPAPGVLALKVARDKLHDYWIGIRRKFGDNPSMDHGAYVVWGFHENRQSDLLDLTTPGANVWDAALDIGQTFQDQQAGIVIRPVAEGGAGADQYLDVEIGLVPRFTAEPTNQTVVIGQPATFTAIASGGQGLGYQWQREAAGETNWSRLENDGVYGGATLANLLVTNTTLAMNGDLFRCVVSNSFGYKTSAPPALLTVVAVPARITLQPVSQSVLWGQDAFFSVGATGGPPPSYQWQRLPLQGTSGNWLYVSDDKGYSGTATSTLRVHGGTAEAEDGDEFRCQVSNSFGRSASFGARLYYSLDVRLMVKTLSGQAGVAGSDDGDGTNARFDLPFGIAADQGGDVFVADSGNDTIRRVTPAGRVATLAGSPGQSGSADGQGGSARFDTPTGIAIRSDGTLFVADSGNDSIRQIRPDGLVSTLAGEAGHPGSADGLGHGARFNTPLGVAVDGAGHVYVADTGNDIIRKIGPNGLVGTMAGHAGVPGLADGQGNLALFDHPAGVAVDGDGNVYVADSYNNRIRKITPAGAVSTLAPVFSLYRRPFLAWGLNLPFAVAADRTGNVYVGDTYNGVIWQITPRQVTTVVAGQIAVAGSRDGLGAAALFEHPSGLAFDRAGNLYIADLGSDTIRVSHLVSLAPFSLRMRRVRSSVVLTWPASGLPLLLESAETLAPQAQWRPVTNAIEIDGDQMVITDTPDAFSRFYRLSQP